MYASNPPGNWQHFTKRQDNIGLPLMEVRSKYLREQLMYEEFVSHTMQQQRLQAQQHSAGGKQKVTATVISGLPGNCIEFVNNTTDGTYSEVTTTTSGPTNYTITWGDGTEVTDVIDGSITISHVYADSDTEYTVRLCFDDISLVTELDFLGHD